jgi:hypothetical protein
MDWDGLRRIEIVCDGLKWLPEKVPHKAASVLPDEPGHGLQGAVHVHAELLPWLQLPDQDMHIYVYKYITYICTGKLYNIRQIETE